MRGRWCVRPADGGNRCRRSPRIGAILAALAGRAWRRALAVVRLLWGVRPCACASVGCGVRPCSPGVGLRGVPRCASLLVMSDTFCMCRAWVCLSWGCMAGVMGVGGGLCGVGGRGSDSYMCASDVWASCVHVVCACRCGPPHRRRRPRAFTLQAAGMCASASLRHSPAQCAVLPWAELLSPGAGGLGQRMVTYILLFLVTRSSDV